jgi:predicted transcriptional regulator
MAKKHSCHSRIDAYRLQLAQSALSASGAGAAARKSEEIDRNERFCQSAFFSLQSMPAERGNETPKEDNEVTEQTGTQMSDLVTMTADVVAAYVAQNSLPSAELPGLIQQIHTTLQQVASGVQQPAELPLTPAVPIKKSITRDYIICLEDGKKFKSLKRHLRSSFDLSPEEYRKKWGLPYDYPMVAPNYAQTRSELAKSMGLGNLRQKAKQAASSAPRAARKSAPKKAKAAAPKKAARKPR